MWTPLVGSSENAGKDRFSQDIDLAISRLVRYLERATVNASISIDLRKNQIRPRRGRKLQIPKYDSR
jgi:hypothetical protein